MPLGFDKVTICNMALSHVGSKSRLENIDEDNPPAKISKLWYPSARLVTLEAYNWGFARKSQALAQHSVAAPTNRWAFRYQWPVDCVAPRLIENVGGRSADALPFEVEEADEDSMSIVTDAEDAVLLYTRDLETVTRFSLHFVLMLALRLGLFINPELSGKINRRDRMQKEFDKLLFQAPTVDASFSVPLPARDAVWIRDRA